MSPRRFLRGDAPRRARRGTGRSVLTVALQALLLAGLAWCGYALWETAVSSDRFTLHHFEVSGVDRADRQALLERLEPSRGQNLLTLDLDPLRRAAQADPWIRRTVLHRRLPHTLRVVVEEKQPVAVARIGSLFHYVDRGGRLITGVPGGEIPAEPWLVGLPAQAGEARVPRLRAGVTALAAVRRARPEFLEEIAQVDLADARRVVLELRDGSELWLPMERYPENLERFFRLREQITAVAGPVRYADLRWDGQIAVLPADPEDGGGR